MSRIVDCHAHIFPDLAGSSGFGSAQLHLLFQQWAMHNHSNQPVRRLSDHQVVDDKPLWDAEDWSAAGRRKGLNFRVGRYGRFEWDKDGESYYIQFLSPSLQEMCSPAQFMVTQMDHAGIESAVLQNDHIYGNLSVYFAEAIRDFPNRFIGLAQVEEGLAYQDEQVELLTTGIDQLGLSGLYFSMSGFFRTGYKYYYDSAEFLPFWNAVEQLKIPVFWVFPGKSPFGGFEEEMRIFRRWLEGHSEVKSVLVHGVPTSQFADDADRIVWPDYITSVMDNFAVFSEILYPIMWGGRLEYPYRRAQTHIKQLIERFGPERLIWGSDMPNVERYSTYRQSLTYFKEHCEYLDENDRDQIFHRNTLRLFTATKWRS
jgi:predicted TIM-barrel fold metal-dependent hydrolase